MKRIFGNLLSGACLLLLAVYFVLCAVGFIALPFLNWEKFFQRLNKRMS